MTLNRALKAAYFDEPANLINYLTNSVRCPSCDGAGHRGMDECNICQGDGSLPREMATYEAISHGY